MPGPGLALNASAGELVDRLVAQADRQNVAVHSTAGATVLDLGVRAVGSLEAGRRMAEVCLAGRGEVQVGLGELGGRPCGRVTVSVAQPAIACLLSQYAGWKISVGKFFAMGSGPMRAIRPREPVFERLGYSEDANRAVGVLETDRLPDPAVVEYLCEATGVAPEGLSLLAARTASIAGGLQVVARSVETCLHKLFELEFDVGRIRAAIGSAWLPPVPRDDLEAIGRTNDSILYGGEVVLWIEGDDESIHQVGRQVPSCASKDYGEPFREVFRRYGGDFYAIDPMLFSPARVVFNNLTTGSWLQFGRTDPELLARSFFGGGQA